MTDDKEYRVIFDPADAPDADRVYANYLRACAIAGTEPVSRERADGLIAGWQEALTGRPEPTTQ